MPRLIDADRLLSDRMREMYYHLPNGDIAIPIIDIENAPTIGEDMAEALECFRRTFVPCGIVCEQERCKWRCEGRDVGLDNGYCAWNNLLGDAVRLLGGEPGKEVTLRDKADRC